MKKRYNLLSPFLLLLLITLASAEANGQGQRPANEDFSFYASSNAIPVNIVSIFNTGNPKLYYSVVSPNLAGTSMLFLGIAPGSLFRPSDKSLTFNYTTGGVIPGADPSATGTAGDYRIHFVGTQDTTGAKLGNFKMQSMYLAIGQGKSATVTVRGFREGKMMAEKQIVMAPGMLASGADPVSFTYSAADAYVGTTLTFGTAFQFLDGLQFSVNDKAVPLSIDDLVFADPVAYNATQTSDINFTNTGGISSKISWTAGGGDRVAVFMAATNAGAAAPVNNTDYTASSTFGSGSQIGSSGWYCVYTGADGQANPAVNVYGLTPGTTYRTMVVTTVGTTGWQSYNTTTASLNVSNFTTVAAPATQAANISVAPSYTDFRAATINWTNGDGAKRAVFVKNNTPGQTISTAVSPLNNNYNADAQHFTHTAFTDSVSIPASSNARVGTSGWYCVYNGTGTSVNMTRISLRPGQTLRVMVVEYNGAAGGETYNTTSVSNNVVDYFNPNFPLPETNAATGIGSSGATLNGSIDPRSANITAARYVYGTSSTLAAVLGTLTTTTPAATTILGSATATAVSASLTGLSPSTTYYYRLAATSNAGTLTATNNTLGATNGINSFTTAPVVSSVSASTANGSYKAGEVIVISVVFSAAVTVTGTPALALNSGGSASYLSGSGTATLLFSYTIIAGENNADLDYASVAALALSGGSIVDGSGNNAALTLPVTGSGNSLGGQKNIVIDTQAPSVNTVTIASNNTQTARAKSGEVVTVSFTSSEQLVTPTAIIAGHALSATDLGGNNWSVSHTMTNLDMEGVVVFEIPLTDLAHNNGTTVTGTTNASSVTFDKTAPTLSAVTIASNNSNNSLAKAGDVVQVSFSSDETIATPTATIAGQTATIINTGGNNWTGTYTMTTADAAGTVPFTISFIDITGNAGTIVATTTNSSSVSFDRTAPTLSAVAIASNNSNNSLAKAGDVVQVSFTSDETIATPTATIAGQTATIVNAGGNNWVASYTTTTVDAGGSVAFSISFNDITGNAGVTVTATTNGSAVLIDKMIPVLSTVTIASSNANSTRAKTGDVVKLYFTASEMVSVPVVTIASVPIAVISAGANKWTASYTLPSSHVNGTIAFSIAFSDLAGNAGTAVTTTTDNSSVIFDKQLPSLTTVTIASGNNLSAIASAGDIVTLRFSADETITAPVVTIAGRAATITNVSANNWIAATTMNVTDAEGVIRFAISITDLAGNTALSVTTTSNTGKVVFDQTKPSVVSIVRQSPLSEKVSSGTTDVTYRVTFSEAVKNLTPAAFVLTTSGATSGVISSVSASSGAIIDVSVSSITGNGTLRLDLKNTGTTITDTAGNQINGGFASGEMYGIGVTPVSFANNTPALALCAGAPAASLSDLLRTNGGDNGQTLTWTILSNPSHGTLQGFPASSTVNGAPTAPAGVAYLAENGYTGNDAFTIQVSDGFVSASATVDITVYALPVASIVAAQGTVLCGATTLAMNASGGASFTWYKDGMVVPNVSGAQLTINTTGTYHAVATSATGCTGNAGNSIVITQLQKPSAAFLNDTYCTGKAIVFTNQSTVNNSGTVAYSWDNGNQVTSTLASPAFTYAQPGTYTITLTVTPTTCPSLATVTSKTVTIETSLPGLRMTMQNAAINSPVLLQARSGVSYRWSPATGLTASTSQSTTAVITAEQQYTVAVTAASGCTTVDTVLLRAFMQNDILLPNAFSPNNDGQNDKLIPNLVGIAGFHYLRIFNRFGKKMYESSNPNDGWDGKLNGVNQPTETYNWVAEGVDKNGVIIRKQGAVTILR